MYIYIYIGHSGTSPQAPQGHEENQNQRPGKLI